MLKHEGNVLVLGQGERAFLSVVRSLGRAGLSVHAATCSANDLALKSRYLVRRHELPVYRPGDGAWLESMETILQSTPYQLVIPCEDQAVIPLQAHRQHLGRLAPIYTLGEQAFDTAFSKIKSFQLAERLGIPQPRSAILHFGDDADRVADFSLPLVVKPPSSFTPGNLAAKRGVRRCRTRQQLVEQLENLPVWGEALIQENFVGTGVGVELLANSGEILVAFQHVRVHEPLEGGGSSYRRSADLHPELLEASKALMRELGYTGVAMVEFKFNFETGRWVFVEINGRFWGSLPLAVAAGVDFPLYLYDMLVQGRREFPNSYRVPIFCRNLSSDQRWLRANLVADKHDPLLATRPLRSVAAEAAHLLTMRERWDTLVADDPGPGVAEIASLVGDVRRKVARSLKQKIVAFRPVRGWLRSQVLARARTADSILFVCKGNICRSPYAEQYARKHLPPAVRLNSCGYYPVSGRPSPDTAQGVAKRFGIDLARHQSRVLDDQMIDDADLIFTFDEENRDAVLRRFPWAAGRVFGLGILCTRPPYRIADPYGTQADGFEAVYAQIGEALDCLTAAITVAQNGLSVLHAQQCKDLN